MDLDIDQKSDNGSILIHLGKMEGMLLSVLSSVEGIKSDHKNDIDNIRDRMNNHGERLKDLENYQATHRGEQNGRRMTIGLVATCILLAAGLFSWFLSNGLNLLKAGAG